MIDAQAWGKAGRWLPACSASRRETDTRLLTELERAGRQGKVFVARELMEMLLPDAQALRKMLPPPRRKMC